MEEYLKKRLEVKGALDSFRAKNVLGMEKTYGGMEAAEGIHGLREGECLKLYRLLLESPEIFRPDDKENVESCISTANLLTSIRFRKDYIIQALKFMKKNREADDEKLNYLFEQVREMASMETDIKEDIVPRSLDQRKKANENFSKMCKDMDGVLNSYFKGF